MENCWVKICTVWPNERVDLWIDADLIKKCGLLQRTVQFSLKDRTKIYDLRRAVVKVYAQCERRYFLERGNPINFMLHRRPLSLQRFDLNRRTALLQRLPVQQQLSLVKLCPSQ